MDNTGILVGTGIQSLNAPTNTNASQFPASHPHSASSMNYPIPVDGAVPCTVRTSWAWVPCTVAGTRQSLTLHRYFCSHLMLSVGVNSWHAHQLHIAPQGIAPRPNVHWMMHGGEACHHTATEIQQ
jgi:hypothetical protein